MAAKLVLAVAIIGRNLPPLLPSKSLVEQRKDFGDVKLNVFEIQLVLVILLHLKQIIELEVEFEQSSVSAFFLSC
jgi:hypothetical protein